MLDSPEFAVLRFLANWLYLDAAADNASVSLQPGTREAASNPIVVILSVVCGVVLVFFLANIALYIFAQQNRPKKAGKRVSSQ